MTLQGHVYSARANIARKKKRRAHAVKAKRKSTERFWEHLLTRTGEFDIEGARYEVRRRSIPSKYRGAAWLKITGTERLKQRHDWLFEFLVKVDTTEMVEVIDRDVGRTFGKAQITNKERLQKEATLRKILVAYSNLDSSLGYCQGMNFIAAHIMKFFENESDMFWSFVSILRKTRGLFCDGLEGFYKCNHIFQEIFVSYLPELFDHFEKLDIHSEMYLTQWFHTLFCLCPSRITVRIWDNFLLDGFEVLIRFALAILQQTQDELLKMNTIVDIVSFLKNTPLADDQGLTQLALSIKIPERFKQQFEVLNELYPLSSYFKKIIWFSENMS